MGRATSGSENPWYDVPKMFFPLPPLGIGLTERQSGRGIKGGGHTGAQTPFDLSFAFLFHSKQRGTGISEICFGSQPNLRLACLASPGPALPIADGQHANPTI